jgi:hypothetical protein
VRNCTDLFWEGHVYRSKTVAVWNKYREVAQMTLERGALDVPVLLGWWADLILE